MSANKSNTTNQSTNSTTSDNATYSGYNTNSGATYSANRDAQTSGAAPRGRAEYGDDRPNFGSARSDYGSYAYGGRLSKTGTERGETNYQRQYSTRGRSSGSYPTSRSTGEGTSSGILFLSGVAIGAALMYILDPDKGRTRRAYVSDKLTSATTNARQAIESKSRDLSNRAQGLAVEAGLTADKSSRSGTESDPTISPTAGPAGTLPE